MTTCHSKAGLDTWKSHQALLDEENMVSFKTGKPMSATEFDKVLDEVWETIATEGFSKIKQTLSGQVTGKETPGP